MMLSQLRGHNRVGGEEPSKKWRENKGREPEGGERRGNNGEEAKTGRACNVYYLFICSRSPVKGCGT